MFRSPPANRGIPMRIRFQAVFGIALLAMWSPGLSAQAKPDRFDSAEACLAALESGNFRYYVPSFLKPVPLRSGEVKRPLEHDACVNLWIVGRRAWVPQAAGTMYDFSGPTAIRRSDCGNKTFDVRYPHVPEAAYVPPPVTAPVPPSIIYTPVPQPLPPPPAVRRSNPWPAIIGAAVVLGGICYFVCRIRVNSDSDSDSHAQASAAFLGARFSF